MTKTMTHADCHHDATKAARAKCRKERTKAATEAEVREHGRQLEASALLEAFDGGPSLVGIDWVMRGAEAFTDFAEGTRLQAARALLDYFAPSGDAEEDASRLRNGYTITTDPGTIRRIILRRFS